MDSDDIGRIISSCCNLQCLNISCSLHRGADASMLLQLPQSCTALGVGGRAFTDTAAPVIAQLTQASRLGMGSIFGVHSFHVSDPCGSDLASGHINLSWDPDKVGVLWY